MGGYLVQQVGGLHQLRAQRVEEHIRGLQLPVVPLGQRPEALPDGIVEGMQADGVLHVTVQHLGGHTAIKVNNNNNACRNVKDHG